MEVSVKTYVTNIIDVLAKIVLPSVESPFARIQLSFAIDMLNQLQHRVEYRTDVIEDNHTAAKGMLDIINAGLRVNDIPIPPEIAKVDDMSSFPAGGKGELHEAFIRVQTASSLAMDLMYEKQGKIRNFKALEKKVMDLALQWVNRTAGLKSPTINLEQLESR